MDLVGEIYSPLICWLALLISIGVIIIISQKNLAVVGVSRNSKKFGNVIYKELKKKGFNVIPVNPNADFIEGDKCYSDLFSLPVTVDGVIISVPPQQTEKIVQDVKNAGIKRVWMQQGSQSKTAEEFCYANNIDCISNECILMFAEPTAFFHRTHRWIRGIFGKLPQ